MVIPLYFDCGKFAFRSFDRNNLKAWVQVPGGSEVLETKGLGEMLFVPSRAAAARQRWAYGASDVLLAAREGRRGFKLIAG